MKVPQRSVRAGPGRSAHAREGIAGGLPGLRSALLGWYRPRARPLRFRDTADPWAILVAEVMAQQTQVARVDERWMAFMARFPTVRAVAAATPADVLRAWAGLGYNRRALALRRTAITIIDEHGGVVPADLEDLQALPGIGPYTARAVAAVAYAEPVAAVDTNVRRVIGRLAGETLSPRACQARADELLDPGDPAGWTHAMMDLGATVCRAGAADCAVCPLSTWCASAGRPVVVPPRRRRSEPDFERTSRWLRGRIISELRAAPAEAWVALPGPMGTHDTSAVRAAIAALAAEGLIVERPDGSVRLPS